ncbi:uncharacterized protein LY79DRAFT_182427 [Colletotrichum navitas]|uniref:Uncharacterized protein n=1 Tax=Colletotrichum navitas TaxID=681940 RepID=A0AAD8Q0Q7_9PEZI|nr:uncharacterized protein LY79DRAFT_182427 [Colletotrichum navitas]KAK1593275.1 hypothetical protein LY79DRAFT_182427 [Colletotrichum navitas]
MGENNTRGLFTHPFRIQGLPGWVLTWIDCRQPDFRRRMPMGKEAGEPRKGKGKACRIPQHPCEWLHSSPLFPTPTQMPPMLPACPDRPSSNPNRLTHASTWPGLASSFLFRPVLSCRPAAEPSTVSPRSGHLVQAVEQAPARTGETGPMSIALDYQGYLRVDEPMSTTPMNQCKCTS